MQRSEFEQIPIEEIENEHFCFQDFIIPYHSLSCAYLLQVPYERDIVIKLVELRSQKEAYERHHLSIDFVMYLIVLQQHIQVSHCQVSRKQPLLCLLTQLEYPVHHRSSALKL